MPVYCAKKKKRDKYSRIGTVEIRAIAEWTGTLRGEELIYRKRECIETDCTEWSYILRKAERRTGPYYLQYVMASSIFFFRRLLRSERPVVLHVVCTACCDRVDIIEASEWGSKSLLPLFHSSIPYYVF